MKKKIILVLIVLLAPPAAFFAAYCFSAAESYHCYNISERIAVTSDGHVYVAYNKNGRPEILKLDSGGTVTDIHSGGKTPWESNTEVAYIWGVYNCEGTVFACEIHADGATGNTLYQVIYKLDENLKLSPFFRYEGGDAPLIASLTAKNGELFVTLLDGDGKKAFVDSFDIADDEPPAPTGGLEFAGPFNDSFYYASYLNGSLYASTMSGEFLRCTGSQTVNILDSPARDYQANGIIEALGADENGLFFYDAMDGFAYTVDAAGRLKRQDNPAGKRGEHTFGLAAAREYKTALIAKEPADILRIVVDGEIVSESAQLRLSPALILKKSAPDAIIYAAASVLAILLVFAIIKGFEKRQRLITKFLFIITPVVLLAFAGFGFSQYIQLQNMLLRNMDSLSKHYNRLVANSISHRDLSFITNPVVYKSAEYKQLQNRLRVAYGAEDGGVSVLNNVFILRDGVPYMGVSLNYPCLYPAADGFSRDAIELMNACGELGDSVTGKTLTRMGDWSTTVSAIKNDGNQLVGYVMTRVSHNNITVLLNANVKNFSILALMIILPLLVLLTLVFRRTLRPINNLRDAMREVLSGNYEVRLNSVTRDEFMGINLAFNKMCADLKTHMYKLERISDSYYRFVPRNILPVLGKKSVLDINYGDSRRFSACCCVLCVHNLSELQAAGTDEDFLDYISLLGSFINDSLKRCGGVLMSSEMDLRDLQAIFPLSAESASSEGISNGDCSAENCEMFAEGVRQFCAVKSSQFGEVIPKITMVLHRADMLYGITGVNDAAFPVLLSEGVDFILRIAPLFENSQAQIVLTRNILSGLSNTSVIEIGWRETPKGGECKLYLPRDGKSATDESFSKGLDCFYDRDFYSARALFSAVCRKEPSNGIAQWYALAADKYLSYPQQFASSQLFGTDVYRIDF